jgi:hypothetical protein
LSEIRSFDSETNVIEIWWDKEKMKIICLHNFKDCDFIISVIFPLNCPEICNQTNKHRSSNNQTIVRILLWRLSFTQIRHRWNSIGLMRKRSQGGRSQIYRISKLICTERFTRNYPIKFQNCNHKTSTGLENQPFTSRAQRLCQVDSTFVILSSNFLIEWPEMLELLENESYDWLWLSGASGQDGSCDAVSYRDTPVLSAGDITLINPYCSPEFELW